jgi:hypothetical protein
MIELVISGGQTGADDPSDPECGSCGTLISTGAPTVTCKRCGLDCHECCTYLGVCLECVFFSKDDPSPVGND